MVRRKRQKGNRVQTTMTICSSIILLVVMVLGTLVSSAQAPSKPVQPATGVGSAVKIARAKYSGGGDWYNDPSSEINLLRYVRANTPILVEPTYEFVDLGTDNLFLYPVIFMTGHGTVSFSDAELRNLRAYLEAGGFLYIDDDYGMDASIRKELKRLFPQEDLKELPFSHKLYHCHFDFPNGLPKIHEHDEKPPQGFGLFVNGKLAVYYTYETNPSDGWADPEVHHDTPERRDMALRIGTNILVYALTR